MTTDRVRDALEAAAARQANRPKREQARCDMLLLLATHLLRCCPIESYAKGTKHRWHRDLQPAINAPGCVCKGQPMRVLGAAHFLAERREAAA